MGTARRDPTPPTRDQTREAGATRPALLCWVSLAVLLAAGSPVVAGARDSALTAARSIRLLQAVGLAPAERVEPAADRRPSSKPSAPRVLATAAPRLGPVATPAPGLETDLPPPSA
ncbi:MAG: hypothetical protein AAFR38_04200 [Planctomycetota bacterium]